MSRLATLAGAIVAASAPFIAAPSAMEAASHAPPATRLAAYDDGGRTPVARAGTELAARRAIGRRELRSRLERALDSVGGGSGAYVYDVEAGGRRLLYSDSARRNRILASNTKLFTTAAYLGRFDRDGRLTTRVFERGRRVGGRLRTLRGSLALIGDGDPALASRSFAANHNLPLTPLEPLADAVRAAGIRRVLGDIRADDTIFDRRRSVPQPGVSGGPWLRPLSGLSFNSGFGKGGYARDPARVAGREFERELRKAGVRVSGRVRVGGTPASLQEREPLGEARSPTAASLIRQTNTPSDNFFAETLLKRLAAGRARQGTTERGARRAERFARRSGSGVRMHNGSGLTRRNRASPRQVAKLLVHMARDERLDGPFVDSLAVAGRTGTLRNRMRGTAAAGSCSAKTGTIDGVSALSGYCRSGAGLVAFSILMNGVNVDAARRAQDAMAAAIARYG